MKSSEFITESQKNSSQLNALLIAAGYKPHRHIDHFPYNQRAEMKVNKLEKLIRNAGYKRSKSPHGQEYEYAYDVDGTTIIFHYPDPSTGLAGWYIKNYVSEDDNVVPFKKKEVEPQKTSMSMAQAFGSEEYNILADNNIKLQEKPSYWEDLNKNKLSEIEFARAMKALAQAGYKIREYDDWEIYSIDPDNPKSIKGPLTSVENLPSERVFVINMMDIDVNGEQKSGKFLVDRTGASKYIRFWRQIGDLR